MLLLAKIYFSFSLAFTNDLFAFLFAIYDTQWAINSQLSPLSGFCNFTPVPLLAHGQTFYRSYTHTYIDFETNLKAKCLETVKYSAWLKLYHKICVRTVLLWFWAHMAICIESKLYVLFICRCKMLARTNLRGRLCAASRDGQSESGKNFSARLVQRF